MFVSCTRSSARRCGLAIGLAVMLTGIGCGPDPAEPFATATWVPQADTVPNRRLVTCADGVVMFVPVQFGDEIIEVRAGDWPVDVHPLDAEGLSVAESMLELIHADLQDRWHDTASRPDTDDARWDRVRLALDVIAATASCGLAGDLTDSFRALLHLAGIPDDAVIVATAATFERDHQARYVAVHLQDRWLYIDPAADVTPATRSSWINEARSLGRTDLSIDYEHPYRVESVDPNATQGVVPRLHTALRKTP